MAIAVILFILVNIAYVRLSIGTTVALLTF